MISSPRAYRLASRRKPPPRADSHAVGRDSPLADSSRPSHVGGGRWAHALAACFARDASVCLFRRLTSDRSRTMKFRSEFRVSSHVSRSPVQGSSRLPITLSLGLISALLLFTLLDGQTRTGVSVLSAGLVTYHVPFPTSRFARPAPLLSHASSELSLSVIAAYDHPVGDPIYGGTLSADSSALTWTRTAVVRHDARGSEFLCEDEVVRPLSAEGLPNGVVEIVDSTRNSVLRHDPTSGCRVAFQIPVDAPLVLAARLDDGWLLAHAPTPDRLQYRILTSDAMGRVAQPSTRVFSASESFRDTPLVTAAGSTIIQSHSRWPFHWQQRDNVGTVLLHSSAVRDSSPLGGAEYRSWIGLAVIPLDRGFIQTLADLRSDSRFLVRYDSHGAVVTAVNLSVPVGFMDSRPELALALGLRETDRKEILVYRWHWHDPVVNQPVNTEESDD